MQKILLVLALTFLPVSSALAQLLSQTMPTKTSDPAFISPETGIDYTPLRNLLAAERWRTANDKTTDLMLQAAGREAQGWVRTRNIEVFSCWDLRTIDSLWKEYSNGHFGFSVQLPIFLSTGNKPGKLVAVEAYRRFGDTIGWREGGDWIIFKENLTFNLNAPEGHLPNPRDAYELTGGRMEYTTLAKRMLECNLEYSPVPQADPFL